MRLGLLLVAASALAALVLSASATPAGGRADVGHGLAIAVPAGWRVTHERFTVCTDPLERFTLLSPDGQALMLQERLDPVAAELRPRPERFAVRGRPSLLACCSLPGDRPGWVLQFGAGGRAFYAFLYPGDGSPATLLRTLDSFAVT